MLSNLVSEGVADIDDVLDNQKTDIMLMASAENNECIRERTDNSGKSKSKFAKQWMLPVDLYLHACRNVKRE
jgi:hypothetical protein